VTWGAMRCRAVLVVLSALAAIRGAGAAPAGSPWRWTPDAVVGIAAVGGVSIAPDGGSIVFTRSRFRSDDARPGPLWANLWLVPFAGGEARRLTTSDGEDQRPRWSPDGGRVAFLSKRGSGEAPRARVYAMPVDGGEPLPLTDA